MALTGMGADSSSSESPRTVPDVAASPTYDEVEEQKNDYRADDEEEDEDEVDNRYDYYIPDNQHTATTLNEVADVDEESKENDMRTSLASSTAAGVIDIDLHTVIQDTSVVKKYELAMSEGDAVNETEQTNRLMTVSVNTSLAVTEQTTSTLATATGGGTFASDGDPSSDDMAITIEIPEKLKFPSQDEESEEDEHKTSTTGLQKERLVVARNVDLTSGIAPSKDIVHEAVKSEVPEEHKANEQISPSPSDSPVTNKSKTPAFSESKALNTSTPASSAKSKEDPTPSGQDETMEIEADEEIVSETPPSVDAEKEAPTPVKKTLKVSSNEPPPSRAVTQDSNTSPTPSRKKTLVAPVHTPIRSKRVASKKRKQSATILDNRRSGEEKKCFPALRRSPRIKNEHPNSTFSGELKDVAAGAEDAASSTSKAELSSTRNVSMTLVQLMGTEALAAKLQDAFGTAPFAGNAPISRFQDLINNDVTGLRHLNVFKLLDALNPLDGPVMQLHVKLPGVRHMTSQDRVESVSLAKARALQKCPLRFPAPPSVAEQVIKPLAKELGLNYAMRQHTAKLVSCPQDGAVLDWRFYRTETVAFQLNGNSRWKMRMGHVEHPLESFEPESWILDDVAKVGKIHRVANTDNGFLSPPGDNFDVLDETRNGDTRQQVEHLLQPGSVAYVPAGAWLEVETQGSKALWLEVQLVSTTYEALVVSALKQLAWGDNQLRKRVQIYPGKRSQIKSTWHDLEACMESLRNEMVELKGNDLLPEYLVNEDMQDLVAKGIIRDTSTSRSSKSIEVDLTNPRFKLKHEKVFKDAVYRVNPVAVLMNVDEIPHLSIDEDEEQTSDNRLASDSSRTPHRALKKTPKPKPRRKQALRVMPRIGKHTYLLDEIFGNEQYQPQLHVKFQCSADQSRLLEWLQCRGGEPFELEELIRGHDYSLRQSKGPVRNEETARSLLRFLCFVGYVTQVKAP